MFHHLLCLGAQRKGMVIKMEGTEITLDDMLDARERRAREQKKLLIRHRHPLICFSMNIAGPVKNTPLIRRGFDYGCALISEQLKSAGLECICQKNLIDVTGNVAFYIVNCDASALKRLTVEIEDSSPVGRLFDMDVLDEKGQHISREELSFPGRKCLICDKPAKECARSRTHTVEELQRRTTDILLKEFARQDAQKIAQFACQSLLYEVCTSPKPGLVDLIDSGSHQDMDCFTFMASASALWPYFEQCAFTGMETANETPTETFRKLRWIGKRAENAMLSATNGVNTHKGAIFSVGIICAALGRLPVSEWDKPEVILSECAAMTKGLCEKDFHGITEDNARTEGQRLYAAYGVTGIRGEVEHGFPTVLNVGLPALEQGISEGLSLNDAGCGALIAMLAETTDTNMLSRGGWTTYRWVVEELAHLLKEEPFPSYETLEALNRSFVRQNLSPGGSADLLSITYFLHFLKCGNDYTNTRINIPLPDAIGRLNTI